MIGAHRRHDMPDRIWSLLEPRLPGRKGSWEGIAHNNRLFKRRLLDIAHWRTLEKFAS
ncbi:hypothetical protein HCUR_00532 [Holospora curviuscula]|uniref:Transposase n=1 Tax=Holospora curviuscula TaxID=1082868 RepID=A0A2S5R9L7_9PROT|nr:hypothetical protein HCUR_00532 [Holospora curviuscula]